MLPMLHRGGRVFTLSSVENNVSLATKAGNQIQQAANFFFFNTANKGSASTGTPALRTGTGWKPGSMVFLRNSATIAGRPVRRRYRYARSGGCAGRRGCRRCGRWQRSGAGAAGSSGGTGATGYGRHRWSRWCRWPVIYRRYRVGSTNRCRQWSRALGGGGGGPAVLAVPAVPAVPVCVCVCVCMLA